MMRFESGAQGFVDTSFAAAGCDLVIEIYGTDGWVWVYNDDGWKIKLSANGKSQIIDSPFEDLYQFQFEHFARCVMEGEQPIVTGGGWAAYQPDPCSCLRVRSNRTCCLVFDSLIRQAKTQRQNGTIMACPKPGVTYCLGFKGVKLSLMDEKPSNSRGGISIA